MRLIDRVERWDASPFGVVPARTSTARIRSGTALACRHGTGICGTGDGHPHGASQSDGLTDGLIGYVGGLREVVLGVERLDSCPADLTIDATRLLEGEDSVMYQFRFLEAGT